MTPTKLAKMAERIIVDNAPAILTGVGVVGTAATAYLTHKSTIKALKVCIDEGFDREKMNKPELNTSEIVKLTWTYYIPPVAVGAGTIASIIFAHKINARRAAALAAAYALTQDKFSDYREKISEKLGVKKEKAIKDELAQEQVNKNPPNNQIMLVSEGKVLCMDQASGRYFHSTVETIKRAVNEVNFEIMNGGWATLSDFYERVGLKPTSISEVMGWRRPNQVELQWSTVLTQDQQPCVTFDIDVKPLTDLEICMGDE